MFRISKLQKTYFREDIEIEEVKVILNINNKKNIKTRF